MKGLRPGDIVKVQKQYCELWKHIINNEQYEQLERGDVCLVLARNPKDENWWVLTYAPKGRSWRDEQIYVLTDVGPGWVVREYIALVK